jgi:hypothetical protein
VGDTIELGQTTLAVRELPAEEEARPTSVHVPDDAPAPDLAATDGEPEIPPVPTTLAIQLEVNFVERELHLRLDEDSSPIRLMFEDGAWRTQTSSPNEKGGPA